MIVGILKMHGLPASDFTPTRAFIEGLSAGYDTMDLLASLFFSVGIWMLLKEKLAIKNQQDVQTKLIPTYVYASMIGGSLLGLIYLGLSVSAAAHPEAFANANAAPEQVLASLAIHLLGAKLAMVANIAILLACLTTIISLAVAVVEVIHVELENTAIGAKIPFRYGLMMFITILITVVFSNLGFDGIMRILHPVMAVCYPAIIVLTLCNILYKITGFKYVKIPVYTTLLLTLIWKIGFVGHF
jgi:LIVCS family branched-chain amino acid:cation transporter